MVPNLKYCPACQQHKDKSMFSPRKQSPDGLRSTCKECKNAYDRSKRQEKSDDTPRGLKSRGF